MVYINYSLFCGFCAVLSLSVVSDSFDPTDPSLSGSSVHGDSQARMLEWAAMSSSRGSSQPRDRTQVSCTGASLIAQSVKNRPAMLETLVQFLGREDQLQKG